MKNRTNHFPFLFVISCLIALFLAKPVGASSYYRTFSDIETHSDLEAAVYWANLTDVMKGTSASKFSPKTYISGKTVVKALEKLDPSYDGTVGSAYTVKGTDKGLKRNRKKVTREQFAVALYNYAKSHGAKVSAKKKLSSYTDYEKLNEEARKAYSWALKKGLVPKASGGRINPQKKMTRAQAVTGLYKLHKLLPDYRKDLGAASFNEIVLREIAEVKPYGGYYTGSYAGGAFSKTAWQGMNEAYKMKGARPVINLAKARPSFCSSACYMVLVRSLLTWDTYENSGTRISAKSWRALKPYTVRGLSYPVQDDGVGAWGRANANGPGMAVLIRELKAGENVLIKNRKEYKSDSAYWSAWGQAEPGDFLKIFRSGAIGASERGHMVVYLGRKKASSGGKRDDIVYYWSSNGSRADSSKGYSIASCRASEIYRGVITKVTKPQAFAQASKISPTKRDEWLRSLLDVNVSLADMKKHIS